MSSAVSLSTLSLETPRAFAPLLGQARYKGAWGGRGSGKSHFFAEALIERALMQPALRAVCIREVQKSLEQSVKRLLEDKIAAMGVSPLFRVMEAEIRTPGKGLIIFQGMQNHTADSIKSLEGYDVAWVEEAQSLSQRSLDLLRPTIRKPGSELWFSWNPRRANDPVEQVLRGPKAYPDAIVVRSNYGDNPWFDDTTLRAEMEWDRSRDPDKYAHIWLGEYERNSEARVFRNWRADEFETPDDARFYHGADWGYAVDPTVLVRCFLRGRTLYVDREAYRVGCEIDHTPALFDGLDPARPGYARAWPIRADSARPETISFLRRNGYAKIEPALKGPNSVKDGIEFLKSYDIVVHPRCKHTIDELTLYSWKTDPHTLEVLPILVDKKNHCLAGDTLVETDAGPRRIDELVGQVGNVYSVNPVTGDACVMPFADVRKTREAAEIIRVEVDDGRHIDLTADHLILTRQGWKEAQFLSEEDEIVDVNCLTR